MADIRRASNAESGQILTDLSNKDDVLKKYNEDYERTIAQHAEKIGVTAQQLKDTLAGKSPDILEKTKRSMIDASHRRSEKEELTVEQQDVKRNPEAETSKLAKEVIDLAKQIDQTAEEAIRDRPSLRNRVKIGKPGA